MTRKELYEAVKKLGLEETIKAKYGRNFTQVQSADLEAMVTNASKRKIAKPCCKTAKEEPKCLDKAFVKMVSILQLKRMLTNAEAKEIMEML